MMPKINDTTNDPIKYANNAIYPLYQTLVIKQEHK